MPSESNKTEEMSVRASVDVVALFVAAGEERQARVL
jgi:hypothetical protein